MFFGIRTRARARARERRVEAKRAVREYTNASRLIFIGTFAWRTENKFCLFAKVVRDAYRCLAFPPSFYKRYNLNP